MVALMIRTGIPVRELHQLEPEAVATMLELLEQQSKGRR